MRIGPPSRILVQPVCSWASPTLPGLPQCRCTASPSIPSTSSAQISVASPALSGPISFSHIHLRPTPAPPTAPSARISSHIGLLQNQVHCPSHKPPLFPWTPDPTPSSAYTRLFAICLCIPSAASKFRCAAAIACSRIVSSMHQVRRSMV